MLLRLLFGLFLGVYAQGEADAVEKEVGNPLNVEFTPETFAEMKGTYFIKFFSPYCGHCKTLAPKWDAAITKVTDFDTENVGFTWGSVNCAEQGDLCTKCQIKAYPSLRVYRDGEEVYAYKHKGTSEENLVAFGKNYIFLKDEAFKEELEVEGSDKAFDPSQRLSKDVPVLDAESFSAAPSKSRIILFTGPDSVDLDGLRNAISEYANENVDFAQVMCVQSPELCAAQSVNTYPSIKVYELNGDVFAYTGQLAKKKLVKFFTFCLGAPKPASLKKPVSADAGKDAKEKMDQAIARARARAKKIASGVDVEDLDAEDPDSEAAENGDADADDDEMSEEDKKERENYRNKDKLDPKKDPKLDPKVNLRKLQEQQKDNSHDEEAAKQESKTPAEGGVNADLLETAGGVPARYQAHEVQLSHSNGLVIDMGEEMFKVAKESNEPWLVEFYSPSCPHCRNLVPEYERLAELARGSVNVGRVNCQDFRSVCEREDVTYFPFITFYTGSVQSKPFKGERKAEKMLDYATSATQITIDTVNTESELKEHVIENFNRGITSFLYMYDASVSSNDWDELAAASLELNAWKCEILSSNRKSIRDAAGVTFSGPAFLRVTVIDTQLHFEVDSATQLSSSALSAKNLVTWSLREKWLSLQSLNPYEQTKNAAYVAVVVMPDLRSLNSQPLIIGMNKMAEEVRSETAARQNAFFESLKTELRSESSLLADDLVTEALQRYTDPNLAQHIAFAYIAHEEWEKKYAQYLAEGSQATMYLMDFYNGYYVGDIDGQPLPMTLQGVSLAAKLLNDRAIGVKNENVHKMQSKLKNVPRPLLWGPEKPSSLIKRFLIVSVALAAFYSLVYKPLAKRRPHKRLLPL